MKKETAVEWLIEKLQKNEDISKESPYINSLLRLAKAMEKEQIKDAYANGSNDRLKNTIKDYYNEIYGN